MPYRRKKFTFAISSPDEFLLANVNVYVTFAICYRRSVCLSVVCLSVMLVRHSQPVEIFGNFFHHMIAQVGLLYFSAAKICWWGRPFPPKIFVQSDPPACQTVQFRQISAHSASTVIASEKSSISTYRKSTTRFPTSHR